MEEGKEAGLRERVMLSKSRHSESFENRRGSRDTETMNSAVQCTTGRNALNRQLQLTGNADLKEALVFCE